MPDNSSNGNSNEWRGSTVRTNGAISEQLSRNALSGMGYGQNASKQFDGKRDLYSVLGYDTTSQITFHDHWGRYQRFGPASALVDRFVASTWQSMPDVEDDGRRDTETEFEQDVAKLLSGEALYDETMPGAELRRGPVEALTLTDTFATVGHYSLLFIGFADGEGVSLEDPIERNQFSDEELSDAVSYLRPLNESQVVDVDTVDNPADPRNNLPESYEIRFDSTSDAETVHHTRLIHVPQGVRTSTLKGTPWMLKGWNRFDDLAKLLGGSAEMAWQGAFPGAVLTPPTDADGVPVTFDDDGEGAQKQVDQWRHGLDRFMRLTGNLEMLDPSVADVSPHIEMQFQALAAAYDIPLSIYRGNETGERATTEDRREWASTIGGRRRQFGEDRLLRPLINRFRYAGAVAEPEGDDFAFNWQSLNELTEQEWAEIRKTNAQAMKAGTGGNISQYMTEEEVRTEFADLPPERGSAAPSSSSRSSTGRTNANEGVDESDPAVQRQHELIQEAELEQTAATDGGRDGGD